MGDVFATEEDAPGGVVIEQEGEENVDFGEIYVVTESPEKDYNDEPKPPDAGEYNIQLFLAERGGEKLSVERRKTVRDGRTNWWLHAPIAARIIDEGTEYHNRIVRPLDYLSTTTIVPQGKQTSGLASIMFKAGSPFPARIPFVQAQQLVQTTLEGEPIIRGKLDWMCQRPATEAEKEKRKNEKDTYTLLKTGMANFPIGDNGEREWWITEKDGQQYFARAYIFAFLPRTATAETVAPAAA